MTVDEPPNENNEQTLDNLLKNDKALHKKELKVETKASVLPQPARYLFTLALAAGFLGMGSSLSILGLTFPTLAANLHKTINDLPMLVVVRGGGYLAGSLFIGLLESKCNLMVLSVSPLFAIAVGMLMTPLILDVVALHVSTAIAAIGLGAYETVGNVLCLYLWGKKAEPVLQFLHFCYCFGSAMTPFLARPFLNEVFHNTSGMNGSLSMDTESASIPNVSFIEGSTVPLVSVPYLVIASFVALVVIFMLAVTFLTSIDLNESQQENTIEQEGTHFRCGMLFLMFLFYFLYVGVEVSFSLFIYKFGISEPPGPAYSRDVSTHLSAMFHFTIVASQFFAIFWSQKFSPGSQ
ncbi:unnamed protein product [Clavelina lepadiformis]|uniref:Uncharacterized protein n=1 Tax=Clavelina lepadiformis TaxID=159417 RepID=A0ABP0GA73_CLALP